MSTDCSMNNIMDTNLYSLRGSTTEEAAHYERLKFLDKLTYSHVNEVKLLKKMEFKRTILELVKLQGIVPRFKEVSFGLLNFFYFTVLARFIIALLKTIFIAQLNMTTLVF